MAIAAIAAITGKMTIRAKHPVREDFSDCSSGNGGKNYYETKGAAVHAYESALAEYGLCFDGDDMIDMFGDNGRVTVDIWTDVPECSESVGCAILMWHRMDMSGRWEFTGYIA
jgi:hypothetical protein